MELDVYQVDAFTDEPYAGNPAGVVTNADGLDERQMIAIARELNNSETAFVFRPDSSGSYDIEVRFFTPTREVPICGHATIASHFVYALNRGIANGRIVQKTKAGVLPVEIATRDGGTEVTMTQGALEFGPILGDDATDSLLSGLRLAAADLDDSLPIQIVSSGHSKVMVPLRTKACLDSLRPDGAILSGLSARIGCNGFFPFTFDAQEPGVLAAGRMFAPAIGIAEDPVTGNANGPLGAYLVRHGRLPSEPASQSFVAKQGEAIGRKGYVTVTVECSGGEPRMTKVGGRAVVAFHTTMRM